MEAPASLRCRGRPGQACRFIIIFAQRRFHAALFQISDVFRQGDFTRAAGSCFIVLPRCLPSQPRHLFTGLAKYIWRSIIEPGWPSSQRAEELPAIVRSILEEIHRALAGNQGNGGAGQQLGLV
jgi:hypothetical protein